MPVRFAFRRMDAAERRHDGPIPPLDPAAPPCGAARERLFRRLAAEQREDTARLRLKAVTPADDAVLRRDQGRLRFYRDQGAAWAALRPK
jgi:hypothetical protein